MTREATEQELTTQDAAPRQALDAAIEAARLANPIVEGPNDSRYAFVPEGFDLKELPDPYRVAPYILQSVEVDDAQSTIEYANRFSGAMSVIIADIDKLKIRCALDWHDSNQSGSPLMPNPTKHNVSLLLRESEEFKRWDAIQNTMLDQMEFAEFLDENAQDIIDPTPAQMIEIARDLEATQGVAFKAGTRLQTGERNLSYETETHVKGDIKVPTQFTLQIPLFVGEDPVDIKASFRFRPRPDGLKLGFVWRRVEYRKQAEFKQIAFRIAENTGLPVFFGR